MKSRRFFRQKTSGGKAIHRQARTAKEKQAFSTLQDQILCRKNADYIHGNRIMFGSISVILLCVGLVNYFNIMFTGIVGRKKELEIMRKIGMTRRQERKLLLLEGSYYVLLVAGLVASVGSIILKGINVYMRKQLSYFTFHYPVGAIAGSIVIMEIVCVIICNLLILKKMKK